MFFLNKNAYFALIQLAHNIHPFNEAFFNLSEDVG